MRIRIAVDIGGTFTDGVAERSTDGNVWVAKCLTTPDDPGEAVSQVVSDLLARVEAAGGHGAGDVSEIVHGTTLVTNTLIERKGVRTGLVVTEGTSDVLDIAREVRYDLYDLNLEIPAPLVPADTRFEVEERINAAGDIVTPLATGSLEGLAARLGKANVDAVAICLLHAYANDAHEKAIAADIARRLPGVAVTVSSGIAREIREYERMSTTVANAYVQPLVDRYVTQLDGRMHDHRIAAPLRIMVSSGGFTSAEAAAASPILLLESGPAGGVLGAVNTALQVGVNDVITFDMGGTTAKACLVTNGEPAIAHTFEAARVKRFRRGSGLPLLVPSIDLIEIGAGGGSIAWLNKLGLLNVGPESAGSVPGPACYGNGGTDATVTDADLVLGYLDPKNFLGGEMELRVDLAEAALGRLAEKLGMSVVDVARGIVNIVNESMATAARVHIAEKGHDPRRFTMVATGGAGPLHAIEVARKLRIRRVLAGIAAGAGSCLGFLAASARVDRSWSRPGLLAEVDWNEVEVQLQAMRDSIAGELATAGVALASVNWSLAVEMRYAGQGHTCIVKLPSAETGASLGTELLGLFEARYKSLYGRTVPNGMPEVATWRLSGRSEANSRTFVWPAGQAGTAKAEPVSRRPIYLPLKNAFGEAPVYERYALPPGTKIAGPAILQERESTFVIPVPAEITILDDLTVSVELEAE